MEEKEETKRLGPFHGLRWPEDREISQRKIKSGNGERVRVGREERE